MSGRHTRGGLNANSDRDASWESRQARRRIMSGGSKLSEKELNAYWSSNDDRRSYAEFRDLDGPAWNTCWCQGELCEKYGDWAGKDEGLPHPKDIIDLALRIETMLTREESA